MMSRQIAVTAAFILMAAANAPAIVAIVDMYNAPLVQDAYADSVLTDSTFNTGTL